MVSRVKAILRRSMPSADTLIEQAEAPLEAVGVQNGESAFTYTQRNGNNAPTYGTTGKSNVKSVDEIRFEGLRICIPERRVEAMGQVATLTAKEFDLLVTLASAPGRVFTRETLLEHIWGYTFLGDGRTVDVHIGTLRKKLEAAGGPGTPHYIKTVWGLGYKFDPEG